MRRIKVTDGRNIPLPPVAFFAFAVAGNGIVQTNGIVGNGLDRSERVEFGELRVELMA